MTDQPIEYTEYRIDPDTSERIPAALWDEYQSQKAGSSTDQKKPKATKE